MYKLINILEKQEDKNMKTSNLLKNPVLKNKMKVNYKNPAGDIAQEIQEQDLDGQAGGTWDVISGITAITLLATWVNDRATQKYGCGTVITVSAECRADHVAC